MAAAITRPINKPPPAALAAGAKAENTPAPIIDPRPMTTASNVPRRRTRVLTESHCRRDAARGLGELVVGDVRQHVLPQREHHPGSLDHPERARQEPDMEVGTAVAPTIEMHAGDVAERQNRALDTRRDDAEVG